jgi:hypothetical protein
MTGIGDPWPPVELTLIPIWKARLEQLASSDAAAVAFRDQEMAGEQCRGKSRMDDAQLGRIKEDNTGGGGGVVVGHCGGRPSANGLIDNVRHVSSS